MQRILHTNYYLFKKCYINEMKSISCRLFYCNNVSLLSVYSQRDAYRYVSGGISFVIKLCCCCLSNLMLSGS